MLAGQTLVGPEYFSVMVARAAKLFGLRLHLTVAPNGVIEDWCLAPAAVHDSQVMPVLLEDQAGRVVLGDGAYHNPTVEPVLEAHDVVVFAPPRKDATAVVPWPASLRQQFSRVRQGVETCFSRLSTVFDIQRPRGTFAQGYRQPREYAHLSLYVVFSDHARYCAVVHKYNPN